MTSKALGLFCFVLVVSIGPAAAATSSTSRDDRALQIRSCDREGTGRDTEAVVRACGEQLKIPGPVEAPTEACCAAVRAADMQCVCLLATPALEQRISMAKLVYVASLCQVPVPAGTKCGDYFAPPGMSRTA